MKLSIVVPVFNNAKTIPELVKRCFKEAKKHYKKTEIIFVDDGSQDKSSEIISQLAKKNKQIKLITFTRNFGQHVAMMAGLRFSSGDEILWIDADLEEPPEYLAKMKKQIELGFEIVTGIRQNQRHNFLRRLLGKIFSFIFSRVCDYPVQDNVTNMRLMTKKCRSYFLQFNERPFIGGMTIWTGAKIGTVKFLWKNQKRKSQYSFRKLLEHGRLGLIVFSSKILKISSLFGFLASFAACFYLIFLAFIFIQKGVSVPGFFTIAGIMALFFGLQSIFLGILGEYLAEAFEHVKQRPRYLINKTINIDSCVD
jgi:glycosyltransferase involved in cell wall biosynthesis